ncbi:MAG TPA: hypothetical protein VFW48_08180, partial [Solirubrobacterales bacterium]|nr:hypothetical protein [Solirubrobacterales bacterium]
LRGVSKTRNAIESGEIAFDVEGIPDSENGIESVRAGQALARKGRLPDVARLIEDDLYGGTPSIPLTRATIGEIVRLAPRPELAVAQPEQWAAAVSRAIRTVGAEQMVAGIVYEPTAEGEWWTASTIPESFIWKNTPEPPPGTPWQGALATREGSASLYDWVAHDSKVEREFAAVLDADERVDLFLKLPRQFWVDTPVGRYSPDWAITMPVDGRERLVLIRETKSTIDLGELPASERLRILAARAHFLLDVGGPVDFAVTTAQDGLRIIGEDAFTS